MKTIIYQVMPRLFGNKNGGRNIPGGTIEENGSGKFAGFTDKVLKGLRRFGYTHVWYTGILDHATQTDYSSIGQPANHPAIVKGRAGSPYAIRDYYNVDADLAEQPEHRFDEFMELVDRTHRAGMKVIIDFVPNHVARNYRSVSAPAGVRDLGSDDRNDWHFSPSNNFYYCVNESFDPQFDRMGYVEYPARATGNDCFTAHPTVNDWYETVKLNYGVDYCGGMVKHFDPIPDTWHKMVEILEFWASHGIDGFRCDMAEMVPVEFWQWAIERIKALNPDIIFIAEIYNPNMYRDYINRGSFDYLYDKVGLYDTLRNVLTRQAPASTITYAWQSVQDIRLHMLNFMENHDEQRIASRFFAGSHMLGDTSLAARRGFVASAVSALIARCPFMIYAGQEIGEPATDAEGFSGKDGRTSIFDYWMVDRLCRLRDYYATGHRLHKDEADTADCYRRLLAIASDAVIAEGELYDLMWLNLQNPRFDTFGIFTFMRHTDSEAILVVANFDNIATPVGINLSDHVFTTLGMIPNTEVTAVELFSDATHNLYLSPDTQLNFNLLPYDVLALKFDKPV